MSKLATSQLAHSTLQAGAFACQHASGLELTLGPRFQYFCRLGSCPGVLDEVVFGGNSLWRRRVTNRATLLTSEGASLKRAVSKLAFSQLAHVCPAQIRVVRSLPRRESRKEAQAMCYSYREYRMEQEARRQREEEERRRREEQAKKAEREKAEKERELVRA